MHQKNCEVREIMKHRVQILLWTKNGNFAMYSVLLHLILIEKVINGSDVILTLQKQNHIKCVTEDMTSPIYISPPIKDSKNSANFIVSGTWSNDDWLRKDTSSFPQGPITDKRWEDFPNIFASSQRFNGKTSIYVSIYITADIQYIQFLMTNESDGKYKKIVPNIRNKWIHFSVCRDNGNILLLQNNKTIQREQKFVPAQIVIKTGKKTFWKRHEYDFKWANSTTKDESTLTVIPTLEKKCLMLYAFVCEKCFLDISTSGKKHIPQVTYVNNQIWQSRKVVIEPGKENNITFYRGKTNETDEFGEWGIDVRWCSDIVNSNTVSYEVNSTVIHDNQTCFLLKNEDNELQDESEKSIQMNKNFHCKPWMFGSKCDVSCENLLGFENRYCQGYRICERFNCKCAWGFYEASCQKYCSTGYWGLSCENRCESSCKECYKATGQCLERETLTANTTNTADVILNWEHVEDSSFRYYNVTYECLEEFSANEFFKYNETRNNTMRLNLNSYSMCNITLFVALEEETQKLIDKKYVKIHQSSSSTEEVYPPRVMSISVSEVRVTPTTSNQTFEFGETLNKTVSTVTMNKTTSPEAKNKTISPEMLNTPASPEMLNTTVSPETLNTTSSPEMAKEAISPATGTSKETVKRKYDFLLPILLILSLMALVSIFVIMRYYYNKRNQSRRPIENGNRDEEDELLSLDNNSTFIDTKYFESVLKIALPNKELENQFRSLSEATTESSYAALLSENYNKNKDRYNLPYDCTRVVLEKMDGLGSGDYINANYIDGYDRPKAYIACQGPKFSTVRDFWRMIWQENIEAVVMATNFIENKKRMCAEYFPQELNAVFECGEMSIELVKLEKHEFYDSRVFELSYTRHSRKILHLHFKWNCDTEEPFYPNNAVPVIKRIRMIYEQTNKPIVIHSSFGVNRTGVLILCHLALQMAKIENKIDFYNLTKRMREQRPKMVNNLQGYILAHLIVLECIMEEEHPFKNSLEENMHIDVINQQLKYLERLCWNDTIVQSWISQDYMINNHLDLTLVDGYAKSAKYLTIKQPTSENVAEFWTMIAIESISCVLFLNTVKFKLWPYRNATSEMIIKIRELDVTNSSHCTLTELSLLAHEKSSGKVLHKNKIFFFELHDWAAKQKIPNTTRNILNIIRNIMDISDSPTRILVAHKGEASSSGLFVALSYLIEKYERELEVDVCSAVRIVRRNGPQFVNTSKELKFIYTSILDYIKKYERYNQIQE